MAKKPDAPAVWMARTTQGWPRVIYILTPRWVEARSIAQTVFNLEREYMEVTRLIPPLTIAQLVGQGFEVYEAIFGPETEFRGALKHMDKRSAYPST